MFRAGERWRHRSTTEIDLCATKVQFVGPEYLKLKVLFLNRQAFLECNRLIDPTPASVTLKRKDLGNWRMVRE